MSEFFLELFSEEIPARMQADAAEHIRKFITDALGNLTKLFLSSPAAVWGCASKGCPPRRPIWSKKKKARPFQRPNRL